MNNRYGQNNSIKKLLISGGIFLLLIVVLAALLLAGFGKKKRSREEIIQDMTVYYATYGEEAGSKVDSLITELATVDSTEAVKWDRIMKNWKTVEEIPVNADVLPNGLPDTDELCLVALGFRLNPDGTLQDELVQRLNVVLKSAEKYPNAYIVCTGGGTAAENPAATEAGQMAAWLKEKGIPEERIIVEDRSITTAQNAVYTYEILRTQYPQVTQLAIISSDYHIATGTLLFEAEATLEAERAGEEALAVVANAACAVPERSLSALFQAGALIELSGDKETAFDIYYEEYDIDSLPPLNDD